MMSVRPRSVLAQVVGWLRVWWLRVPEPRVFSIGWGVAYAVLCATGVAALVSPPVSVVAEVGHTAAEISIGGLNIVGTLIATVSGYFDYWKGERLGIGFTAAAAVILGALLWHVNSQLTECSTLVVMGYVAFATVVLGVRYLMIRWYTFRPRG